MSHISVLFDGKLHYLKSYNGYNMVVNLSKLHRVITYFQHFPLKTKKSISFFNWLKVFSLVINKEHLTVHGLDKISKLKNKINTNHSTDLDNF